MKIIHWTHGSILALTITLPIGLGMAIAKGSNCEMIVTWPAGDFAVHEKIPVTLKVVNETDEAIAIAKPLLPRRWTISYSRRQRGKNLRREWFGGVVQGSTDSGLPPRYHRDEYVLIPPGGEYAKEIDLSAFLRDHDPFPKAGKYKVKFFYDHVPNESEKEIPLLDHPLESKQIVVRIAEE